MATVYPFRAYRYNPSVAAFDRVLTQPYDKITPAMQEKYYAADPHNLISIEKGRTLEGDTREHNVYTRAAVTLKKWIAHKVVVQDEAPAFYAYTQEYNVPGTSLRRTRRGFIGLGKLEDYSAGVIFRHEHTLSGPKADRLELLRHTHTLTGQLFMLYADPRRQVDAILSGAESGQPPVTQLTDEYGVIHRLWPIAEPERIAAIQQAMADQKLVIADGHHRYETSLNFRNESRTRAGKMIPDAPYESSMMTFINSHSEGLTILPTHRVVSRLPRLFLERGAPFPGAVVCHGSVFDREGRATPGSGAEVPGTPGGRQSAACDRRLPRGRCGKPRLLCTDAPAGSGYCASAAGSVGVAAAIGCGAAAPGNFGAGPGNYRARRGVRSQLNL